MYNIDKKEIIRTFKLFYMGGSNMKKFRNILAMLMVFVMLVAVMPMNVFAGDTPAPTTDPAPTNQEPPAGKTELQKEQEAAKEAVGNLPNLSDTEKEGFKKAIDDATDKAGVDKALEEAKAKDAENKKAAEELAKAKDDAKKEVGNLPNLSDEEKKPFNEAIDKATDKADIDKAVADARTKDANNKKAAEEKKALDKQKEDAKKKVDDDKYLSDKQKEDAKKKIEAAQSKEALDKVIADTNKLSGEEKDKQVKPTPETTVKVVTIGNGTASVDNEYATKGQTVKVTATPYSGYAVARVYLKYNDITKNINTYYNGYYYDGRYYGRYNDYNKYLDVYENSSYYLRKYDSYREFLRYEYPSHYRYYEDYDYWTDRYDYDWYNRYDNYYYKYFDDFRRSRSDTYEEYLRAEHYTHYRDYYNYRYDYNWYNRYGYTTTDTFEMPASNVTVYVEFTDAYPYYYDDYYYYRARRDRKAEEAKAKAEAAKKEEEEAKAKAEAEKQPQIYENKAVISIGSNVLDKVSKNVHTVHQMDAPAYVNGGRVMLPLRYVAEALGLQVSWVPETKTVIIWDLTQRVEIPVKSNRIIVNGITYTSDVKPEIKNERTMLPIANIARALGLIDGSDIIWDQYNKQVTLTRKVLSK